MLRNTHRLFGVHPRLCAAAIKAGVTLDFDVFVAEGKRSEERQLALYNQGRSLPGSIVTNAKPKDAPHTYGLALDLYPATTSGTFDPQGDIPAERWTTLANSVKSVGGIAWGGDFKSLSDKPHFELENWKLKIGWMGPTLAVIAVLALVVYAL
jgi:peptidoglycan L-alanyl-D-glutamate endopeptidase CwlK